MFLLAESASAHTPGRGEADGCLKTWLDYNRRGKREGEGEFFYSNGAQPIEKSQFGKINASKLESIY